MTQGSTLDKWMDRLFTPLVLGVVLAFGMWAIGTAIRADDERVVVVYTPQRIERVLANGDVNVPQLDGFDDPAVCLGDTVPARGVRTVDSEQHVAAVGTVVWKHIPPGPTYMVEAELPYQLRPGTQEISFENEIPPAVTERTLAEGEASMWQITGRVEVELPNALDATWSTAQFWVVDCER